MNAETSSCPLSVIIPVFNTEQFLPKAIDSVLSSTLVGIEILVVDDCSNGNCKEIVEKYQRKCSSVKYIEHARNLGLFQSRLTGVLNANGEYIAFLDADDYAVNDIYKTSYEKVKAENLSMLLFNVFQVDNEGKSWSELNNSLTTFSNKSGQFLIEKIFSNNAKSWIWHTSWNKLIKRSFFEKAILKTKIDRHLIMFEDLLFSFILYLYSFNEGAISMLQDQGLAYFRHSESITLTTSKKQHRKKVLDTMYVLSKIKALLWQYSLYNKYEVEFNRLRFILLYQYAISDLTPTWLKAFLFLNTCNIVKPSLSYTNQIAKSIANNVKTQGVNRVAIFGTDELSMCIKKNLDSNGIKTGFFITTSEKELAREEIDNVEIRSLFSLKGHEDIPAICIGSMSSANEIRLLINNELSNDIKLIDVNNSFA